METQVYRSFDSVVDFVQHSDKVRDHGLSSSEKESFDFRKTKTFEEAMDLSLHGWSEGAEQVKDLRDKIEERLLTRIVAQRVRFDVAGSVPDVSRFCTGEPECMMEFEHAETYGQKSISIAINTAYSCLTEARQVNLWGATVVALIDAFEHAGTRVGLVATTKLEGRNKMLHYDVIVKDEAQPLDIDRVAFVAAHPSYLRRITFGVMEGESEEDRRTFNVGGGYGHAINEITHDADIVIQNPLACEEMIKSVNASVNWIEGILKQHNIQFEERG